MKRLLKPGGQVVQSTSRSASCRSGPPLRDEDRARGPREADGSAGFAAHRGAHVPAVTSTSWSFSGDPDSVSEDSGRSRPRSVSLPKPRAGALRGPGRGRSGRRSARTPKARPVAAARARAAAATAERRSLRPARRTRHGLGPRASHADPVPDPQHAGRSARRDGRPIALGYHTGHWEVGCGARRGGSASRGEGASIRRVLHRPLRRPQPGHARDDGQPALPQRRGRW
jgi:hypothetical protein